MIALCLQGTIGFFLAGFYGVKSPFLLSMLDLD